MELSSSGYLYALATLAMTFIGFCAIVISLHRTADKSADIRILRQYTRGYIELGFSSVCSAMLAPLLAACGLHEPAVWGWASGLIAIGLTAHVGHVLRRFSILAKGQVLARIWINQVITMLVVGALALNAAGYPIATSPGPVIVAATWRFVMAMIVFLLTYEQFLVGDSGD